MKKIILIVCLIIFSSFAYADLSDFPDNFIKADRFNGYIVVGKDGNAFDVLSQNVIGMKINSYMNTPQSGINKLDTETTLEHNLILIGNPCVNKLSSQLLNAPSPCDKDFPADKAYIQYFEKEGKKYILVAGKNSNATKKAAEYLADFENKNLIGNEIVIPIETTAQSTGSGMPPSGVVAPPPDDLDEQQQQNTAQPKENKVSEPAKQETNGNTADRVVEQQKVIIVEEKGFFQRVFDWFKGIFGKLK